MKTTSEITLKRTEYDFIKTLSQPPDEWAILKASKGERDGEIHKCIRDKNGNPVLKNGKPTWYIPGKWYIIRLNEVVGNNNWDWSVINLLPTALGYLIHGRLVIDGATRDGIGGADFKFQYGQEKTPMTVNPNGYEDTGKSAETDALKRACEKFGLGLWLSVDEESAKYAQTDEQRKENIDDFKLLVESGADERQVNKALFRLTKPEQVRGKQYIEEYKQQKLLNK